MNIYIATSIKGMQKKDGIVGVVMESEQRTVSQFGIVKDATENKAQLLGIKYALKCIRTECELVIHTDNTYICNAFEQEWIAGWIERGWKTAKGKNIANKEEWETVLTALAGRKPTFIVGQEHSFKGWLRTEIERRMKKYE